MISENTTTEVEAADTVSTSPAGRRRKKRGWVIAAVLTVVTLCGAGVIAATAAEPPSDSSEQSKDIPTVDVIKGTLTGYQTVPGVLDFAGIRGQGSGFSGVLTGVAGANTNVGCGGVLFSVNNVGVYLFLGGLPAWRTFESGMSDGPDVLQLEQNLQALGFFSGEPDSQFRWSTVEAINAWQKSTNQERSGRIDFGRIVFNEQDVRIAEVVAAIGDQVGAGAPIVNVSDLTQVVTADVKLADQKLAAVDKKVEVLLPGGVTSSGTITQVGQPTEREQNGQKTVAIPLTITLDAPEDAAGIQRANVTVNVPSDTREDVLSVPVDALIAIPSGGFGVEVVDADGMLNQIPVETGLFAAGRVEISGEGVVEGLKVAVPGT